jgi:hypothetical protein
VNRSLSTVESTLPPRRGGVRALLECAPGADVVPCAHERALPGEQGAA